MKRVGIYTNVDERCGNAEYGRDLIRELTRLGYGIDLVTPLGSHSYEAKVVIINWSPSRVPTTSTLIRTMQSKGKKVVVIWQESYDRIIDPGSWDVQGVLEAADAVVVHEPVALDKMVFIPHGISIVATEDVPIDASIGVAGFPFAWKNFELVASIAKEFGLKCKIVAPRHPLLESRHTWRQDTTEVMDAHSTVYNLGADLQKIKSELGPLAEIREDWMSVHDVIMLLASCTLNMYWFQLDERGLDSVWGSVYQELGQSGSVRMAIAAGRPMIISEHRKFKTLLPYSDEFYIAKTTEDVRRSVQEILDSPRPKVPNRILHNQGWPTVAKQYQNLIERLAA